MKAKQLSRFSVINPLLKISSRLLSDDIHTGGKTTYVRF